MQMFDSIKQTIIIFFYIGEPEIPQICGKDLEKVLDKVEKENDLLKFTCCSDKSKIKMISVSGLIPTTSTIVFVAHSVELSIGVCL